MRKLMLVFISPLLFQCGGNCDCDNDGGTTDASNDGAAQACTTPAQCGAGAPVCCGTVVLTGGTAPNCTTQPITSVCSLASSCPTTFVPSCSGTEKVHICTQASDCASDPANDKCCTFTSSSQSLTFCASQSIASGSGATCL